MNPAVILDDSEAVDLADSTPGIEDAYFAAGTACPEMRSAKQGDNAITRRTNYLANISMFGTRKGVETIGFVKVGEVDFRVYQTGRHCYMQDAYGATAPIKICDNGEDLVSSLPIAKVNASRTLDDFLRRVTENPSRLASA